ncbi:MAG: hypothetical protein HRT69_04925 [Flavobacteriaceae bacterium]|jgi:hypothetical protein|nr:hypothetical protein [Flavobacteriaceae bacterium]
MFTKISFWKKSKKELELDCYNSIDELPIKIWFDIHKTVNFKKLLKSGECKNEKTYIKLFELWQKLYNEFIERFGLSDEFLSDLQIEIKIANLQADLIITKQKHLNTLIKIEQEKMRINNFEISEPADIESILAKMSKYYGFKLSSRELTTAEYYSYLNNITDGKTSN